MRLTKYTVEFDEARKPILAKERSFNYSAAEQLNTPEKIVELIIDVFRADKQVEEHVWLLVLNAKLKPVGVFEVSHGSREASACGMREIFMRLCLCGASAFTIVHNHPTGDCFPSKEDRQITETLKNAAKLMQIKFLDHIIIGAGEFYSFTENKNNTK